MTFGPDIVLRCPGCNTLFLRHTLGSGNTIGAKLWSDGYYFAPMFPIPPVIEWCVECKRWFFIEDAEELFSLPMGKDFGEGMEIGVQDYKKAKDYQEAIESFSLQGMRGMERELILRTRLLWEQNDFPRHFPADKPNEPKDKPTIENLESIAETAEYLSQYSLAAEAYRELGDFRRSFDMIERARRVGGTEDILASLAEIEREAKNRVTDVFLLSGIET